MRPELPLAHSHLKDEKRLETRNPKQRFRYKLFRWTEARENVSDQVRFTLILHLIG